MRRVLTDQPGGGGVLVPDMQPASVEEDHGWGALRAVVFGTLRRGWEVEIK